MKLASHKSLSATPEKLVLLSPLCRWEVGAQRGAPGWPTVRAVEFLNCLPARGARPQPLAHGAASACAAHVRASARGRNEWRARPPPPGGGTPKLTTEFDNRVNFLLFWRVFWRGLLSLWKLPLTRARWERPPVCSFRGILCPSAGRRRRTLSLTLGIPQLFLWLRW